MTQVLYAHMNNKTIKKKENTGTFSSIIYLNIILVVANTDDGVPVL
jgi:hypothetical protein